MKVHVNNIENILSLYSVDGKIVSIKYYINSYDTKKDRYRIIFRVVLYNHNQYIVKLIREKEHSAKLIEEQSIFSEHLRANDINTPKRYMFRGEYCNNITIQGIDFAVTVEDFVGEELEVIDLQSAFDIGKIMGRIHYISEKDDCHISGRTLFHIIDGNDVNGYKEFVSLRNDENLDLNLYNEILKRYNQKLDTIRKRITSFKSFATQGDISINNISKKNDKLYIFDYNNAGDVPLVSDMILEGLLLMYNMDLSSNLVEKDRYKIFEQYYKGYTKERTFSAEEQEIYNDIYKAANCMWFSKININDDSLSKSVERKDYNRANKILVTMLEDIW